MKAVADASRTTPSMAVGRDTTLDRMRDGLRVMRWAAFAGWQERVALFTWRTWIFGWLLRVVTQVLFFALIGLLLGSVERLHSLFVGNIAAIAALGTLSAAVDAAEERYHGTLPLLIAAPLNPVAVLLGRCLLWIIEAVVTAGIAFFLLAPLLGLSLNLPRDLLVIPLIAVLCYGTYGFAVFLASFIFRAVHAGNIVFNFVFWAMAAICGVNVATSFFPVWVRAIAYLLPLTHGLQALRALLAGASAGEVLTDVAAELLIGSMWMALTLVTFRWFAEGGRRTGTLEFTA